MRPLPNSQILRQNGPFPFAIERSDPVDIGGVLRKLVAESDDFVVNEKNGECLG
jgi:hypothetical protein